MPSLKQIIAEFTGIFALMFIAARHDKPVKPKAFDLTTQGPQPDRYIAGIVFLGHG